MSRRSLEDLLAQQQLMLEALSTQMARLAQQQVTLAQQQAALSQQRADASQPPSQSAAPQPAPPADGSAPPAQLPSPAPASASQPGAAPAPPPLPVPPVASAPPLPFFPQVVVPAAGPPPQLLTGLPPALHTFQPAPQPLPPPPLPPMPQARAGPLFAAQPPGPGLQPPSPAPPQAAVQQVSLHPTHMPLISAGSASIFGPAFSFSSSASASAPGPAASPLESLFSPLEMPKGLAPIVHAESEAAPRTYEALQAMLTAWIQGVLDRLRGTSQWEQASTALWRYVNKTLQFAMEAGVHHAVNYHRAASEAASHSPPLYDPLLHGEVARHEYILHILPHIGKGGSGRSRASWKRTRQTSAETTSPQSSKPSPNGSQRPSKRPRGSTQTGDADRCTLHPFATHSNAQCNQQRGNQPGAAQAAPASSRDT